MIKTIAEAVEVLNQQQFMKMRWEYHESLCPSFYQSHVQGHYSNLWSQTFDVPTAIAIARSLNGDYEALEAENQRLRRDREQIIRNAHRLLRRKYRHEYLWAFITDVCAVGSTSAMELCRELEWDPHQRAGRDLPSRWAALAETEEENVSGDNAAPIGS